MTISGTKLTTNRIMGRDKQRANIVYISTVYSNAEWMQGAAGGMLRGVLTSHQLPTAVRALAIKSLGHAIYAKCAFE